MPPRHLKSQAVSIAFCAWLLGHYPSMKILSVTYAQDLSDHLARQCRTLMASPFYQAVFPTRISKDREAAADFETTDGGNRFATSLAGVLTGRGADVIIADDLLKADDASSDVRRQAANERWDNTVRTRLNNQTTGSIISVMQRLHVDDLVAHVQEQESWEVLSLAAIAEEEERYEFITPYGRRRVHRSKGELLAPALMSREALESQRRGMTDYNFDAQYRQNPQPLAGNVVKRDWLRYYTSAQKPDRFDQILQSWDTASKDTELANYSVCTTWGIKDRCLYLLDVFRQRLDFPDLKRAIHEQARRHNATIVLIEDKASGIQLLQELRADSFSLARPAPKLDGEKVMRLRAQTPKIANGFVLFPEEAPWLATYLRELLSFPDSKYDDQVDATVLALAWVTEHPVPGIIEFYRQQAEQIAKPASDEPKVRAWVPPGSSHYYLITGRQVMRPSNGIIAVTEEELGPLLQYGGRRMD
jgi:predicted phage terminase large subunit-like protein